MSHLIDTNVLARLIVVNDPRSQAARAAIDQLQQNGVGLVVTPQNLIEFWAVATRPVEANGLGLSVEKTREEVARFDARLVAIMLEGDIDSILTFNIDDFRRYPKITVVSPQHL